MEWGHVCQEAERLAREEAHRYVSSLAEDCKHGLWNEQVLQGSGVFACGASFETRFLRSNSAWLKKKQSENKADWLRTEGSRLGYGQLCSGVAWS